MTRGHGDEDSPRVWVVAQEDPHLRDRFHRIAVDSDTRTKGTVRGRHCVCGRLHRGDLHAGPGSVTTQAVTGNPSRKAGSVTVATKMKT